jgi:hypothetical protein
VNNGGVDSDVDDTITPSRRALGGRERPGDFDDTVVPGGRPDRASDSVSGALHDTAPVVGEPLVEESTPRYGFRVGRSDRTVLLDAPAYVGRAPSSPRIQNGLMPKLVRVPSPNGEVSGTHLELRQLGTSVVVTDLRSTNGSTVSVPGSLPRSLRQGESMVVTPGTLVDIGDGNIIEILPLQRRLGGYGYEH